MREQLVQVENGEWTYKGYVIQEQSHPKLKKYGVFKQIDEKTLGSCWTKTEAKKMVNNELRQV